MDRTIASTGIGEVAAGCESPLTARDLPAMDWTHVRPVYRALHAEFWRLTRPFGIELSPGESLDLAHLIAAMDAVDREVDELNERPSRERLCRQVAGFLASDLPWEHAAQSAYELGHRLTELRHVIVRHEVRSPFVATVESIFRLSEEKRFVPGGTQFLQTIRREWRLAGALPLMILGQKSTPRFKVFFLSLCEAMHAVDTMLDARRDFREGRTRIRPGLMFYLTLCIQLAKDCSLLFIRFPHRTQLMRYAIAVIGGGCRPKSGRKEGVQAA